MSENSEFIQFKDEIVEILEKLTYGLVEKLVVNFESEGEQWRIDLDSQDNGILIGHQGENLLAIQHILRTLFHARHPENRTHFILDVAGYRSGRERFITNMVRDLAYREVLESGKTIVLKGLNSYERRLIHNSLADYKGIETNSIGNNDNRRMIIRPTSGSATTGIEDAKIIDMDRFEKEIRNKTNSN